MANTFWHKQTPDQPLFPDTVWARPENRSAAGKLLIVGGNSHGFAAPANAYSAALKAGIGTARAVVPDALKRIIGTSFPEAEFAASTPSGSFSRGALAQLLELAEWSDGLLLAGDFGKNSETAILLESFTDKYQNQLNLTGDSLDYFINTNHALLTRYSFVITADLSQLQKLIRLIVIKHSNNLLALVGRLHEITAANKAAIITLQAGQIIVAVSGQVSTTPTKNVNLVNLAAYASVWLAQQPKKPFGTLSSAAFCYVSDAT